MYTVHTTTAAGNSSKVIIIFFNILKFSYITEFTQESVLKPLTTENNFINTSTAKSH